MAEFNCSARKRNTFKLTMPDENETVVLIRRPNKNTVTRLFKVFPRLSGLDKNFNSESISSTADEIHELAADIINNNQSGYSISQEELGECMDFFMIIEFMTEFMKFLTESITEKN